MKLSLGIIHTKQGDYEAAIKYLSNSLDLARKGNLHVEIASLSSLADLHIRQGEPEAARPLLAEAERLALEMKIRFLLPEIYRERAQVELAAGQPQAAQDDAKRSVNLARDLGLDLEEGMSLRVLGQVLLASGQHKPAMTAFEQSLSLLADRDLYEAARTRTQWGLALVSSTDADRGKILLEETKATFQKLVVHFKSSWGKAS